MNLIPINPNQVEWLYRNQPHTVHTSTYSGMTLEYKRLDRYDYSKAKAGFEYYLTPDTYNQLPIEFKQLR